MEEQGAGMSNYSAKPADAPAQSYDGVWIALHWIIVGLVLIQYFTKIVSPGSFPGVSERSLNAWHLAVGPTILLLMLVRLAWRLTHPTPPAPTDIAKPLQLLSRATHWAFYALLIILPILGWVSASGYGAHPTILGLVELPQIAAKSKSVGETWGDLHGTLAWVVLAVIGLHICGAIYHAVAKEDGVFQRMLPVGGTDRP